MNKEIRVNNQFKYFGIIFEQITETTVWYRQDYSYQTFDDINI